MYLAAGFVGVVELFFRAPDSRDLAFVGPGPACLEVVGRCAVDDTIIVRRNVLVPDELSHDPRKLLDGFVRDILWAWGCADDEGPGTILEAAMENHLGQDWKTAASKLWDTTK